MQGLNLRPRVYETRALPAELMRHKFLRRKEFKFLSIKKLMAKLGLIKDAIKEYEKKVPQSELEQIMQELASKYGISIKNVGNESIGFIPEYNKSNQESWYEQYSKELSQILAERYK